MERKSITTIVTILFLVTITIFAIPVCAKESQAPVTKVPYDVKGDVQLVADGTVIMTSTEGSEAALLMTFDEPISLDTLKDWDLSFHVKPLGGEPGNPYAGTDVPYYHILVAPSAGAAVDAAIDVTGTYISFGMVNTEVEVIANPAPYAPGSTFDYRSPGWVLGTGNLDEYGVPSGLGQGGWPGVTLTELVDLMLAAQPEAVFTAVGVQIGFGTYDPNMGANILSVAVDNKPVFPNASSDAIVLLKTGVLNQGQANSLIVKINKGNRTPYENEVKSLYAEGILTETQRDGLLFASFY